jgi:hypothetical protein
VAEADERMRTGGLLLWFGVGAGTVAWLAHVSVMAAFTPFVCNSGQGWWFHLLSVVLLVPTVVALAVSAGFWRAHGTHDGVGFLGALGTLLNGTMAMAIVAEWVPVFLLDACLR